MTAIAGAVRLDGGPPDRALVARMLDSLGHRGGVPHVRDDGPAALGGRTRGAVGEPAGSQPLVAFHGVLYDRAELGRSLGFEIAGLPDAALVAAALARWDVACLPRLSGDFAFAAWDGASRRLVCARDPVGTRPLHYTVAGGFFLLATELHALLACAAVPRQPNLGIVAELLSDQVRNSEETLFEAVRRVPAAHVLVLQDGRSTLSRYWSPPLRDAPHASDDEWAAAFCERFDRAVARRVADQAIVAVELSGGLDSTAVAAMAARRCGADRVRSYSLLHDAPACDERQYVRAAATALGHDARFVDPAPWDPHWLDAQAARYLDWPGEPATAAEAAIYRAAAADGLDTLLTGEGGDEWFTGSRFRYADLLSSGNAAGLAAELWHAPAFATAWRRLVFAGAWPLLPAALRERVRRIFGRRAGGRRLAPWLHADFVRASGVEDRRRVPEYDPASGASRATWDIARYLGDGEQALAFDLADRTAAAFGIAERYPFYDRDLIEFALALPEAQRYDRGESKRVVRRAMSGLIPDAIRDRREKAEYSSLVFAAIEGQGGERAFERLAIADAGWVRGGELRRAYRHASSEYRSGRPVPGAVPLWRAVAADAWFRHAVLGERTRAGTCR